jgi:hypothetical protein
MAKGSDSKTKAGNGKVHETGIDFKPCLASAVGSVLAARKSVEKSSR